MTMVEAIPVKAHKWEREKDEHYVENFWCSERLFAVETFDCAIWDPCCGFGRIPLSAIKAGHIAVGTDIRDRGYVDFAGKLDFLDAETAHAPNIVCNPPFNIAADFSRHALSLSGVNKVAMIFPTARLNAARWLQETPLARIWLMTPRPSMPPGHTIAAGEKPGGGKTDFCWLVWTRGHVGPPAVQWLHRNPESQA